MYRYMPAGGEAVVAVKRETGYQLFRFFAFESYLNNQDEDTRDYLELYGISEPMISPGYCSSGIASRQR